jgi:hypothetical protein
VRTAAKRYLAFVFMVYFIARLHFSLTLVARSVGGWWLVVGG